MQAEIFQYRDALEKVKGGLCYPDEYREVAEDALNRKRNTAIVEEWKLLSATEVCAGNPAIAEYVKSLESRLDLL